MTSDIYSALLVLIMALITVFLRVLPFIIFRNQDKTPAWVKYLGKVLPQAIIGMLVIYCLRTISFTSVPFGIPEIISCAVVAVLQFWKNNTVLSIVAGTVMYMILIQLVFAA